MEVWERVVRELGSMPVLLWLALLDKKHLEIKKSVLFVAAAVLLVAGGASFCCFSAGFQRRRWEWQTVF